MLDNLRGVSPLSETMSEGILERSRAEKALINKTPTQSQVLSKNFKNYSDKNGNNVTKNVGKGRKTFAFWTLVCLLFVLAIGNLMLTFTILAVLRLGQGMESMEFLPELGAVKLRGAAALEHVYKRDGLLESFRDAPLRVSSDGGAVHFNLQTRASRSDTRLVVNASGVFACGASALELRDPASGALLFSTAAPRLAAPHPFHNLHAKQVSSGRISAAVDEDLLLRSETSAHLRGAEGTHMEAKEVTWSADQDISLKSVNGSVVLSGKDGVYLDVRYLPLAAAAPPAAAPPAAASPPTPPAPATHAQYKVCVCMPQGKLFRVAERGRGACARVQLAADNPCA